MYGFLAAAALMASPALALSVGSAVVVNACKYDVYVFNTPSEGGGYSAINTVLSPGATYSQQWTQLSNNNGWSIKLSPNNTLDNIMQYEYTYQNTGIIWYDLSDVNGNPWNADWEITAECASAPCVPKQQAYRYSTDDAYGMQACNQDAVITVTVCSGESQDDSGAASASSVAVAQTSTAAASTFSTPSSTPATTAYATSVSVPSSLSTISPATSPASFPHGYDNNAVVTPSATTFATSTTAVAVSDGYVVVEVETEIVTDIVYATAYVGGSRVKRNEAARRHQHHAHGHA